MEKSKRTKALSIFLSLMIAFSGVTGIPLNISAEGANLELAFGEARVAESTVTVPVEVVTNPGFRTLSVTVDYDEEVLQLTAAEKNAEFASVAEPGKDDLGNAVPGDVGEFGQIVDEEGNNVTTGSYIMTWAYVVDEGDDVVTTDAEIATLTFEVLADAVESTDITLTVTEASDSYKNAVAFTETVTGTVELTKPCEHTETKWVTDVEATPAAAGSKHEECVACGQQIGEAVVIDKVASLAIIGATLTLQENISINFMVDPAVINLGYTDLYLKFTLDTGDEVIEVTASEYYTKWNYWLFSFAEIAPQYMNLQVQAVACAKYNGVEYTSPVVSYGVKDYCANQLGKNTSKTNFTTLLVDLLNYGSAMQTYTKYDQTNLVNSMLNETQAAWGTESLRTLNTHLNQTYETIENPTASWMGAGLLLKDSVCMYFLLSADDVTGVTVDIKGADKDGNEKTWTFDSSDFVYNSTYKCYYIYFEEYYATQMSVVTYATAYKDGAPISNTLSYSIESYAQRNQASTNTALAELVKAMMKYGDSAYRYKYNKEVA